MPLAFLLTICYNKSVYILSGGVFALQNTDRELTAALVSVLANLRGIAGRESAVGEAVAERLRRFVPDAAYRDGSVTAHIGCDADKPNLLLCAHLDQVGFIVTGITDDGFLRIAPVGGMDRRLLLGQSVIVDGKERIYGVISILPPHLLKGGQAVPEDTQLAVDLGFSTAAETAARVSVGDAVYFDTKCKRLQGDRLTGSALDDRCGVAALILAAEQLAAEPDLPCNVTIFCSGQEERGGRGAKRAAQTEHPDYAIAVDVTFAMAKDEDPQECMTLGGGPAIGISPVLSHEFSEQLIGCAKMSRIIYQLEIMPDRTGTDADELALAPNGCQAATVSIPLRYMHTPVEVISLRDVELTAQLLVEYAKECGIA